MEKEKKKSNYNTCQKQLPSWVKSANGIGYCPGEQCDFYSCDKVDYCAFGDRPIGDPNAFCICVAWVNEMLGRLHVAENKANGASMDPDAFMTSYVATKSNLEQMTLRRNEGLLIIENMRKEKHNDDNSTQSHSR